MCARWRLGPVRGLCEGLRACVQGKDMKNSRFWKVSLALAWRAQWEDMALDGEKMEEKNL